MICSKTSTLAKPTKTWFPLRGGVGFVGLLDAYASSLDGLWSMTRRLVSSYTGPIVRIRRSGDNTESDFTYDIDGNLDTTTLLSWVIAGGGTQHGHVVTAYDQLAGALGNLIQTTAASQGRMVVGGVLQAGSDGRPSCLFSTPFVEAMYLNYSRASGDFTAGAVVKGRSSPMSSFFSTYDFGHGGYIVADITTEKAIFGGTWIRGGVADNTRVAATLRRGAAVTLSCAGVNELTRPFIDPNFTNPIFGAASSGGFANCDQLQEAWLSLVECDDTTTHGIETAISL